MDRRCFMLGAASIASPLASALYARSATALERLAPAPVQPPRISIIIDDVGFSSVALRPFYGLDLPLAFAVFPCLPRTAALANGLDERGYEVLLHQPMEPYRAGLNPGKGVLKLADSAERIARITRDNLAQIPQAIGVNNHMGSRFTAHTKPMEATLAVVKQAGLFFVDSRTTGRSVAYRTAQALQVSTARRDVFLDNRRDEQAITKQLRTLVRISRTHGSAIGIGHPYGETARAIRDFRPELARSGVEMVRVSSLVSAKN